MFKGTDVIAAATVLEVSEELEGLVNLSIAIVVDLIAAFRACGYTAILTAVVGILVLINIAVVASDEDAAPRLTLPHPKGVAAGLATGSTVIDIPL